MCDLFFYHLSFFCFELITTGTTSSRLWMQLGRKELFLLVSDFLLHCLDGTDDSLRWQQLSVNSIYVRIVWTLKNHLQMPAFIPRIRSIASNMLIAMDTSSHPTRGPTRILRLYPGIKVRDLGHSLSRGNTNFRYLVHDEMWRVERESIISKSKF